MIKYTGSMGSNYGGDDKIVVVHTNDIALAAAEELQKQPPEKTVRYGASDELTCNEAAGILGYAIGMPDLKWLTFTDEQTANGLLQNSVPAYMIPYLVEMGASIHNGKMGEDYELNKPISMGQIKMQNFATEFAIAFKA